MALIIPKHIEESGLIAKSVTYTWGDDPWDCEFEVPRLEVEISALYSRAVMALAAATAEWVIWPLSHGRDPLFIDFIEACWAAAVDRRYLRAVSRQYADRIGEHYRISPKASVSDQLWKRGELLDPVRGPQFAACHLLCQVADRTAPDDSGSDETVYLSNLVDQVTKKSKAFRSWRRVALDRLQKCYGLTEEDAELGDDGDFLGPPVPREALVMEVPYSVDQGPALVRAFLKRLDPAKNRFLTPPEEMKQLGYEGTPYDL